jgi:hypothetical protein
LQNLRGLQTEDIEVLKKIVLELKLNKNYQNELFYLVSELAQMRDRTISELLKDLDIWSVIKINSSLPVKAKHLMDLLRSHRSPRIYKCKRDMMATIEDLKLEKDVTIEINPSFEENFYTAKIKFTDGNDLKNKLMSLLSNENIANLKEITSFALSKLKAFCDHEREQTH